MTTHNDETNKAYGILLLPTLSAELLSLVKTRIVYDLSYPISVSTPYAGTTSPFSMWGTPNWSVGGESPPSNRSTWKPLPSTRSTSFY